MATGSSPYNTGSFLELASSDGTPITAEIVRVMTMTMSCVMIVKSSTTQTPCILKLYDRRFAAGLRKDERVEPWTPQLEHQFSELVDSGKVDSLFERWAAQEPMSDDEESDDDEEWDDATEEAWLQHQCLKSYKTEVRCYDLMHDMQGTKVPRLLGKVTLLREGSDTTNLQRSCPGILLEYISGFPLTDTANNLARSLWQETCDKAISIIQSTAERGILNRDVNTRSFIVCKPTHAQSSPQVFMIDFGLCTFRDEFDDEQEWRREQAYQDEEGAIGYVMLSKLKGDFLYYESDRALRLSYDFMREEGGRVESYEQFAKRHR